MRPRLIPLPPPNPPGYNRGMKSPAPAIPPALLAIAPLAIVGMVVWLFSYPDAFVHVAGLLAITGVIRSAILGINRRNDPRLAKRPPDLP